MLHTHTVEPLLVSTLGDLMKLDFLNDFYLVGGTGLALLKGHRNSVDIDLFTHSALDTAELSIDLVSHFEARYKQRSVKSVMLFCFINDIKVDFVNTRVPLLFPIRNIEGLRIADIRDIALLKLQAILKRGSKKDFIDLFILLQEFPIGEIFEWFNRKYPNVEIAQALISMTYFADAEDDPIPHLYIKEKWTGIKDFIRHEVNKYIKTP